MAYDARVIQVMIASPSDVPEERKIVRDVIEEWNTIHSAERSVVLLAVGWETHSSPELSGRPQQIINERLLAKSDLLVGIFWTRVGSPTGKAISGSVEEIEEHMKAGKPVMLYFSNVPAKTGDVDNKQYEKLTSFKGWAREKGLVESYETKDDFRDKFRRQLQLTLQNNSYLKSVSTRIVTPGAPSGRARIEIGSQQRPIPPRANGRWTSLSTSQIQELRDLALTLKDQGVSRVMVAYAPVGHGVLLAKSISEAFRRAGITSGVASAPGDISGPDDEGRIVMAVRDINKPPQEAVLLAEAMKRLGFDMSLVQLKSDIGAEFAVLVGPDPL